MNTFALPITIGNRWTMTVVAYATVLDDEFTRDVLMHLRWHRDDYGYPRTNLRKGGGLRRLHRMVYEHYKGIIPKGMETDHIDRNPLNAVPANLRAVTHQVNCANKDRSFRNTSGYTRVHLDSRNGKWIAQLPIRGTRKSRHLGVFDDAIEAARAVNKAYSLIYPEVPIPNPEVEIQ